MTEENAPADGSEELESIPESLPRTLRAILYEHKKLARKAWREWDRDDPHRPTVDMLLHAGELEDRRKVAEYEARLLAGIPLLFTGKRKRRRT